MAADKIIFKKI